MAAPAQVITMPLAEVIAVPQWRESLQKETQITIKEQLRLAEVLTVYDMNNKYIIENPEGHEVYFAKESSGCLQRQCCPPMCRHWRADVSQTVQGVRQAPFIGLDKPFSCTCLCANRPQVDIVEKQGETKKLGTVKFPFACCDKPVGIFDANDEPVYNINVDGMGQCGIYCPCPCSERCRKVDYKITDPQTGVTVSKLQKRLPNCPSWCFGTDINTWLLDFKEEMTPDQRGLLLASTLALDFTYFNAKKKSNEN